MLSKNTLKLVALIAIVVSFSSVMIIALSDRPGVELTQERTFTVPEFNAISLLSAEQVTEALFKGEGYKLLNVWASWCGICQREHNVLLSVAQQGVPIVGLNYRDQTQAARDYLSLKRNPYQEVISDPNGKLAIELGVIGTPETYLIDQNGQVLIKYRGEITVDKWNELFSEYLDVSI
ncbi:DsbE family thiol:disulfide interchange protein [Vibrio alfacsensis]|uniref:DsbE family thiol:disulfide interchange protein n=1 Tax=Vibrio alfacsensis TaxID=1074311 RepID=UPI0040684B88